MPFKTMGLNDPLVQGILATGYSAPTEIQSQAIPAALEGRDLIASAQTGTGKTAAFVLPILDKLFHNPTAKRRRIKALIITPTRELAVQIDRAVQGYGQFLAVKTLPVYGGVSMGKQTQTLRRGVDIVVATPGRLMDHINRKNIDLSQLEVLVLDEADRMLDMGFIHVIKQIIAATPKSRQSLLFSATISPEIQTLSKDILKDPQHIQIGRPRNPVETVTQHICPVPAEQKMDLLKFILEGEALESVLVFSRTKHGADKICRKLKRDDISAVAIHSNRTQNQRQQALDGFRRGKYQVLVATDIAARGINIEGISHVVNYDVPAFPEDYIHRIGRTGRAQALGDAITFVSRDEIRHIRKIEKFIGKQFEAKNIDGFAYTETISLTGSGNAPRKKSASSPRRKTTSRKSGYSGPGRAKKSYAGGQAQTRKKRTKKSTSKPRSNKQRSRKHS